MKSLLRTVVTAYVLVKVTPKITKGVAYIAGGAMQGITDKIVKDVFVIIDGEEKPRRNLRRTYNYEPGMTYRDYEERCKGKA